MHLKRHLVAEIKTSGVLFKDMSNLASTDIIVYHCFISNEHISCHPALSTLMSEVYRIECLLRCQHKSSYTPY